ncbi:putative urease accessory protein ureD-like [Diplodia seriata]|uniref:Putative urease accessory protein ureD-like n=1 Tax=Diplodia seriata TaxID=420778 RepID=A0A1S8B8T0_9PEZI|nr:putative urease accessory protein ureD-like [Diplodia seriata]
MNNPFAPSTSRPGHGSIVLSLLPPSTPVLRTVTYQYPLKLIAPEPVAVAPNSPLADEPRTQHVVHTVFVLTYGGGLVAGDAVTLRVALAPATRLCLLTQGSTKIFKAPSSPYERRFCSGQTTDVRVAPGAALCFLPDPVQPFAESGFVQKQRYVVLLPRPGEMEGSAPGSLCVLDWVSEGRSARGEHWDCYEYTSRNEVWLAPSEAELEPKDWDGAETGRLLLRDNVILNNEGGEGAAAAGTIVGRMDELAAFGTLILYGAQFELLGNFFLDEFQAMPRIGAKKWHTATADEHQEPTPQEAWRAERLQQEVDDGVLWTAAAVRGAVLVKFGAKSVEGARKWLGSMIKSEGTVEKHFGERAVLCLK